MEEVISYLSFFYPFRFVFFFAVIVSVLIRYFYQIFKHAYKNGFLREKSLDISFISILGLTLYPLVYLFFSQIPWLFFLKSTTLEFSTLMLMVFIFFYSKVNKISFFKILDFVFLETSLTYFWFFASSLMLLCSVRNLGLSLAFAFIYLILRGSQRSGFNSLFFGIFRASKTDEVTFIGGNALLFLIYHSVVVMLNMFLIGGFNIYLFILGFGVLIYCLIKFISLSKQKKILWTLNLFRPKKKDLPKKDKIFLRRLID